MNKAPVSRAQEQKGQTIAWGRLLRWTAAGIVLILLGFMGYSWSRYSQFKRTILVPTPYPGISQLEASEQAREAARASVPWLAGTEPEEKEVDLAGQSGYEFVYRGEVQVEVGASVVSVQQVFTVRINAETGEIVTILAP